VAASVDLAAYRIVQEGLTNALKHADHPTRVVVSLDYRPAELAVEVADDATRRAAANGAGHGLRGIRERAALLGGSASSGPAPGGGFRVAAVLPDDRA
jgi:signal transduction histidine kinase